MTETTQQTLAAPPLQPTLTLSGELNIFTAASTKTQLLDAVSQAAEDSDIDIDLSSVSEIDSAGLQLMVMAKRDATRQNKRLRFVRHSEAVVDLIELCDLAGQLGDPVLICPKN